jgi:hypothetical protein
MAPDSGEQLGPPDLFQQPGPEPAGQAGIERSVLGDDHVEIFLSRSADRAPGSTCECQAVTAVGSWPRRVRWGRRCR